MILEISCEVRERGSRNPRRETFTTAAQSMDEVDRLIAARFPGKWCVRPEARVVADDPCVLVQQMARDDKAALFSEPALKRKPGRPPKHG